MAKFSDVQRYLLEDYLNHLTSDTVTTGRKSYLKGLNTFVMTSGSFWLDFYVTDADDLNYTKIQAQVRKISDDYFSFYVKGE